MRQQIRDELSKIDQEYRWVTIKSQSPDEFQLSHPEEKPPPAAEKPKIGPLSPERKPEETTIDIAEGQKGISYEKLFMPYLRGAKQISLCDPYIRLQYQIFNLMSFCEIFESSESPLTLKLVTGCDAYQQADMTVKFEELKKGLAQDNILLEYSFNNDLHDRWIETETRWRIILGRGLDIFQKPADKFTLGFMDQTKRRCKATKVVYTRIKQPTPVGRSVK